MVKRCAIGGFLLAVGCGLTAAQPPGDPGGGPPFGGRDGPGGPGGPMGQQRKLLKQFDKNGDGWLNTEERAVARAFLKSQGAGRRGGFGPPGGFGGRGGGER